MLITHKPNQSKITTEPPQTDTEATPEFAASIKGDIIGINHEAYFKKALEFINEIGIETEFTTLLQQCCFLPGLLIENGRILIDRERLLYPGDILHEAAHIALTPAEKRGSITGADIGKSSHALAEEMAAIAWSYAACVHLGLHPYFVFHGHGYRDAGKHIADNFSEDRYFGVPILQWLGMTGTSEDNITYPAMLKWKRD
jgi:hypothetical protein